MGLQCETSETHYGSGREILRHLEPLPAVQEREPYSVVHAICKLSCRIDSRLIMKTIAQRILSPAAVSRRYVLCAAYKLTRVCL
jgi:hypothetical protein